jgi:hypothetical protein
VRLDSWLAGNGRVVLVVLYSSIKYSIKHVAPVQDAFRTDSNLATREVLAMSQESDCADGKLKESGYQT